MAFSDPGSISDTFRIQNEYTPLHKSYILSIRPKNLPGSNLDKMMIASVDTEGEMISYAENSTMDL